MTRKVHTKYFSGGSHLMPSSDDGLGAMVVDWAIRDAKRTMVTANVTALTDNGGGAAADGTIGAITAPSGFTETGTASAQKAEMETALGAVKDALTEVEAKIEEIAAILPCVEYTGSIGGTAADNTIAAIDMSMTAVATSIVSVTGLATVAADIKNIIATQAKAINALRYAVGLSAITDNSGGTVQYDDNGDLVSDALSVGTGTAVDGTALSGVSKTAADTFLASLGAAVKELSTAINAVRAVTAPTTAVTVAVAAG